jgi:hypothetical protein
LGVLVSMFTAVVVTRTLLRVVIRQSWGRNLAWYGVKLPAENEKPKPSAPASTVEAKA